MFRRLRWHWAKKRLALQLPNPRPPSLQVRAERHTAKVEDFPPTAEPYLHLAELWDQYAASFALRYDNFLFAAERYYRFTVDSVLDLACGTGLLTRQIAGRVDSVVGLEVSKPMLERARSRTAAANVRFVAGDFRAFDLGETFDAAVCGHDSLNYIQGTKELAQVFTCVRRHLRPGGIFVFDTLDARFFQARAGIRVLVDVGDQWFDQYSFFDPRSGVNEARVVFEDDVERHRRIAIEEIEVDHAANDAGLSVAEHFSSNTYLWQNRPDVRQFYVLRAPA